MCELDISAVVAGMRDPWNYSASAWQSGGAFAILRHA